MFSRVESSNYDSKSNETRFKNLKGLKFEFINNKNNTQE